MPDMKKLYASEIEMYSRDCKQSAGSGRRVKSLEAGVKLIAVASGCWKN